MPPHESTGYAKSETQAATWLTPGQVDALRDAVVSDAFATYQQDRNEAMIALLYDLGLRRSELTGLDVDHYDREGGVIVLPASIQKGEQARTRSLELGAWGADATRALERHLRDRDAGAMFASRQSDRITPKSVNNVVKKAARVAEIDPWLREGGRGDSEDVSSHTLRHSVAYRIVREEDGRLEDVQLRLRHRWRDTTERIYSHLIPA